MIPFKLDIKESKRLVAKGILCIIRFDGKKLYVRLGKVDEKGNLELMPLSKEELKEAEIQESEQIINDQYFDFTVEESAPEFTDPEMERIFREQQEKLRKKTFDPNSQEDMLKAKELAEQALKKLGTNEEIQKLRDENEDYQAKLEIIAERELDRKRREINAPSDVDTAEKLVAYEKGLRRENNSIPSGNAPLNAQQMTGQSQIGFASHEELIDFLRNNPTPENEQTLRDLFTKAVRGSKQRGIPEYSEEEPQTSNASEVNSDIMNPLSIKDPNIESDIEKYNAVLRRRGKIKED